MTTDHLIHKYQPGPTLPPLRPFSFPSSHPSDSKFSRNSLSHPLNLPPQSASPISHLNQSSQTAHTANRSNQHSNSYHPYHHVNSKVSPRREREPDRQSNSAGLSPEHSLDRQNNNLSPPPSEHGKYTNSKRASLVPSTLSNSNIQRLQHLQQLKRTASRAELDHQSARAEEDVFPSEDKLINHGQPKFNSQGHHEKEVFVKPEYLTPHLPSQPLPSQPTHSPSNAPSDSSASGGAALSPRSSSDSDRHPVAYPTSRTCSVIRNPATSSQRNSNPILPGNLTKKRRMTITNEGTLIQSHNGHVSSSLTESNQSSSPPDSRTVGRTSISAKHTPESFKDPASPLIIGFPKPRDPIAMQQVANTLKLKEEQKRLIEQRRNSFAGQSSLKSFSFTNNPPTANSIGPPPSQDNQCSPRSTRPNRARTSISKPVPPSSMNNNPHKNGLMKLLWHPGLPTPLSNSSRPAPQPIHGPHSPTVSLSPINEASVPRRQSISQSQHQAPASQPALNQQTHHHRADSPEPSNHASPKQSPLAGSSSTPASRRVEEKVKRLELTTQALQAHMIEEPSVRSAPIRGGFFQQNNNTANGNLVQGPLISRQSLTARQETTDPRGHAPEFQNPFPNKFHSHPSNMNPDPQHALRSRHPTGGVRPGHAHEHPSPASDIYKPGLERRRTLHTGSLIQVPTLNHFIGKPSQAHGGRGPAHGPPAVKLINPNGPHELHGNSQQKNAHHPSVAPHQPNSQPSFQHSASNYPHPRQMSCSRYLIGAAGGGSGIPSKQMFLQLFETFYDSLTDCKILQSNLEEHDRRSGQLLTLLQQSSGMFEKMLDDRMSAIQKEFTRDMQVLEGRIERLEERTPPTDPSAECNKTQDKENTSINSNDMSSANPPKADAPKNNQQEDSEPNRKRSASRTSGSATGSNGEERTITSRLDKLEESMGIRTTNAPQDPASSPQP